MKQQENGPLVSVVMPAYNAEEYIEESLLSVLNQSMSDLEVIVVDDCSRDGTCAVVERMVQQDPRIKLFRNPQNMGVAASRNRAFELSRGQYVALLDSDDLWYPQKLEKQIELAKRENADIVYCSYAIIDEDGEKLCADFLVPEKTDLEHILTKNVIGCLTVLLTHEVIRQYPFPQGFYHEDLAYWLQLLQAGKKAVGVTEVQAAYRFHSGSRAANKLKSAWHRMRIYRKLLGMSYAACARHMVGYAFFGLRKYQKRQAKIDRKHMEDVMFGLCENGDSC